MFKFIKTSIRFLKIYNRIQARLPKQNPDTGLRYAWDIEFNFHTKYDPQTGFPLKQKSLPSVKIVVDRFHCMNLVHPTWFEWSSKQIKEDRWTRLIDLI